MKRIETKRKKPKKSFRKLFARSGARRQRAATASARDFEGEGPNQSIGQVLLILLILHVVAIAGIYVHSNFIDAPGSSPSKPGNPIATLTAGETTPEPPSAQQRIDQNTQPVAAPLQPTDKLDVHRVGPGETYATIAASYKVPVSKLRAANKEAPLTPGISIYVPKIEPKVIKPKASRAVVVGPRDSGKSYKVAPGDTLSKIARENSTTIQALMDLNGIDDPRKLRAGQELKLPR